jgi:CubicO group peptidase (beta-lactamase class C family)
MKKGDLIMLKLSKTRLLVLIFFLLLWPYACKHHSDEGFEAFINSFDARIPAVLEKYDVPGAAIALVHNGEVAWSKGYGFADKAKQIPVTPKTVFQTGSISKAVAAWGVMRLFQEGKINLDAPVETYLTRWHLPETGFDNKQVTIRRLLSHSAGLSRHGYPGRHPDNPLPTLEQTLTGSPSSPVDVRVIQEPGKEFRYSGGGYTLLSLVLEEVTGEGFCLYMRRNILEPLGMTDSDYCWTDKIKPRTAVGYDTAGKPWPNFLFGGKACCSLYSTAPDLARFMAALVTGPDGESPGRGVLTPKTLQLMQTPVIPTSGLAKQLANSMGLGYFIASLPNDTRLVLHGGDNRGWHAIAAINPDNKSGIVVLTNGDIGGIYFWIELFYTWSNRFNGSALPVCGLIVTAYRISLVLIAGLGLGWLLFAWLVVHQVRRGRRKWNWKFTRLPVWRRILFVFLPLLLLLLWWKFVPSIFELLIPLTGHWLNLLVTLWGISVVLTGFSFKRKPTEEHE